MAMYSISRLRKISARGIRPCSGFAPQRLREEHFVGEARGDGGDQGDHECFDQPEAAPLQRQNDQHVQRGDQHAGEQRQAEQEFQRDRRAQHFGKIARRDRDFAQHPQRERRAPRIVFAAGLRQIAAGDDAELRGQRLQQHRHQVADDDHAEQRVAEFRAAADVGGPVAGVHVADGDQVAGAGEREDLAEPRRALGDRNGAVGFREGRNAECTRRCGRGAAYPEAAAALRAASVSNSAGLALCIAQVNYVKYPNINYT